MARILIVDDDQSVLALERLILTEAGHDVLLAHEVRKAMDLLSVYPVDLMIVDIMMPDLSGFQMVNMVKNNPSLHETPVAFLTSKNNAKDVVRAAELGADFYIMKPIDREDFVKRVAAFFAKKPPRKYPGASFASPPAAELRVFQSAQITSVSDLGIEILTEVELELDQVLELSAAVLHEIPLKQTLLRVLSTKRDRDGFWRVRLTFVELDLETIRKVQRWIAYKQVRPR
ncbi:MAG: PleD family two-component system response regulator [Bdellovibrionales bacterium]